MLDGLFDFSSGVSHGDEDDTFVILHVSIMVGITDQFDDHVDVLLADGFML